MRCSKCQHDLCGGERFCPECGTPIGLPAPIATNIGQFTGRAWLLEKIAGWLERPEQRFFLLTGGPGTGKSMVSAWLAGYGPAPADLNAADLLARLRTRVAAVHFCQANSRNVSPQAFAENIANQLICTVPGFGAALAATLKERVQISASASAGSAAAGSSVAGLIVGHLDLGALGDELSFDRAFTQPLKRLYADGYAQPLLILVDALDEAQIYTGVKLPALLARLTDLPQLRIIATSRPDPEVLKCYRAAAHVDLILDAPPDVNDVRCYAACRLTGSGAELTDQQRESLAEHISAQAKGVFLYAAIVLDELLPRLPDLPGLEDYPLPDELGGLYRDFLNRELGKEAALWRKLFRPVLGLIAVAQGAGLSTSQLAALRRDELGDEPGIDDDVQDALYACKQYLSGELPAGPFRPFHRSFAEFLLEDDANVDYHINSAGMNRRIADYYWRSYQAGWRNIDPPDKDDSRRYGLDYLAFHLDQAGDNQRLAELITQKWMAERFNNGGNTYDGFIADLTLAWQRAHEKAKQQIEAGEAPEVLAECVRYGLIQTSISTLASSYLRSLVKRAVETGLWDVKRALSVVYTSVRVSDAASLARAILEVEPSLLTTTQREELTRDLFNYVESGELPEWYRLDIIKVLAPYLSDELQRKAFSFIESLGCNDEYRSEALISLAPYLSEDLLRQGLAVACRLSDASPSFRAGGALASRLSEPAREMTLRDMLANARRIVESYSGGAVDGFEGIAPYVRGELARDLLNAFEGEPEEDRARVLQALAPAVDESLQPDVFRTIETITAKPLRARVLAAYATWATDQQRREILAALPDMEDRDQCLVLKLVAPTLRGELLRHGLAAARLSVARLTDPIWGWAQLLQDVAGQLSDDRIEQELASARASADQFERSVVLAALATGLSGPQLDTLLRESLEAVRGIRYWYARCCVLDVLAPQLPAALVQQALLAIQPLPDGSLQALALAALSEHLCAEGRERALRGALAAAQAIGDEDTCRDLLAELAPFLSGELVHEALTLAETIASEGNRVKARVALVPRLEPGARAALLPELLAQVTRVLADWELGRALSALAPYLSADSIADALATAETIAEPDHRVETLACLAPYLPDAVKERVLDDCLGQAHALSAETLAVLVPALRGEAQKCAVTSCLSALEAPYGISEMELADTLAHLAPYLGGDALHRALTITQSVEETHYRLEALAGLVPCLSIDDRQAVLAEWLGWAREIPDERDRASVLCAFAPHVSGDLLQSALAAARELSDAGARADLLTALAPRLENAQQLRPEILQAIAESLKQIQHLERQYVLGALCGAGYRLREPYKQVDALVLDSIACSIIEVCNEWAWP